MDGEATVKDYEPIILDTPAKHKTGVKNSPKKKQPITSLKTTIGDRSGDGGKLGRWPQSRSELSFANKGQGPLFGPVGLEEKPSTAKRAPTGQTSQWQGATAVPI